MQGAIRNLNSLKKWFYANGKPFFTLNYAGQVAQVIMRNTVKEDLDQAWEMLSDAVETQAEYGRATLHVIVYDKDKSNNPAARTNIDVLPNQSAVQVAGIGSIPGYGVDVEKAIADAREKWELEARIQALENQEPDDIVEKFISGIERVAATPLGMAIVSRFMGTPMPPMAAPAMNGGPDSDMEDGEDLDTELDDLEAIARENGMTLKAFLNKTATLAKAQPGVVALLSK